MWPCRRLGAHAAVVSRVFSRVLACSRSCSCSSPPHVELAAFDAVRASAQLAFDTLLTRAAARRKWLSAWDDDGVVRRSSCTADVRALLARSSTRLGLRSDAQHGNATLQMRFDYRDPEQDLELSVAAFLIVRGRYATLMWPVTSVYERASAFPWNRSLLEHDWGAPRGEAQQPSDGLFSRRYEHGVARLDCNAHAASFTFF